MHSNQRILRTRTRRFRQSKNHLLVADILPEQPDSVFVRNNMRHRLQQQLRGATSLLQVGREHGDPHLPDQPVAGLRVRPATVASVQQRQQGVERLEEGVGLYSF